MKFIKLTDSSKKQCTTILINMELIVKMESFSGDAMYYDGTLLTTASDSKIWVMEYIKDINELIYLKENT